MKAITDEDVVSLMKDLKKREEKARETLDLQMEVGQFAPAQSATVFNFEAPKRKNGSVPRAVGEVISIAASRAAQNAKKTKRGIFVYATEAPQPA